MTARADVAAVLAAHGHCSPSVEVHEDRSGTLHYSCGTVVKAGDYRGLNNGYDQHLAAAITAHLADVLGGLREEAARIEPALMTRAKWAAMATLDSVAEALGVRDA